MFIQNKIPKRTPQEIWWADSVSVKFLFPFHVALFSLSRSRDDSRQTICRLQNGGSSSVYFSEEEIVSLPSPVSPPLSLFLTLQISDRTEWASLFIGPLNDLLKGPAMNGWRGWGGMRDKEGRWRRLGFMRCMETQWAMPYIAEAGRQGPPPPPRTSMQQQHQAPALVTPGSCRWAPCPFLVQEEAQSDGLSGLERHTEFNRLWDKEQRGH